MELRSGVAVALWVVAACGGRSSTPPPSTGSATGSAIAITPPLTPLPDDYVGLDLRLSDGKQGAPAFDRTKLAAARPLADADTAALLARGKPLVAEAGDQVAVALRPATEPPPRPGSTVASSFPPPPFDVARPTLATAALAVVRHAPDGDVEIAPQLSVTFDQPMVAITSQDAAASSVPVKLTPQPNGTWRWLGTRTLAFDPDVRFPQATTFAIDIPAGTRSATGGTLAAAAHYTFTTSPVRIVTHEPADGAPQRTDVPIVLGFDQKIDPHAMLGKVLVTAGTDGKPRAIRLATPAELAKDPAIAHAVEALRADHDDRWLAIRTVDALPVATHVVVTVPAGTPSAEGPNPTTTAQEVTFETYARLDLGQTSCAYLRDRNTKCNPSGAFYLELTNPLDADAFTADQLTLDPPVAGAKVEVSGRELIVSGPFAPRTTYKLVLAATLRDEFGQTLGKPVSHDLETGDATPAFFGAGELVVLDPALPVPTLDFFTRNYKELVVKLYRVTPADAALYFGRFDDDGHPRPMPGTLVVQKTVPTAFVADKLVETDLDLTAALPASHLGHVIAVVEPRPFTPDHPGDTPPQLVTWVEVTRLAVDPIHDDHDLVAFATDLATGKPIAGATVQVVPGGAPKPTDANGLATLEASADRGTHVLVVRRGDDVAFTPERSTRRTARPGLAWYVTDDRRMYRPGETVTVKGYLRAIDRGKGGDTRGVGTQVSSVTWRAFDRDTHPMANGAATVDAHGGFDLAFKLPPTPTLGSARIELVANGWHPDDNGRDVRFEIEEFRRPEFEVTAHASEGPFVLGGGGDATVEAKYYAGGPLAGAATRWSVTTSSAAFSPPNHPDFEFGAWTPWWSSTTWSPVSVSPRRSRTSSSPGELVHAATTDGAGAHVLHLDFLQEKPVGPRTVTARATVTDVNRQAWSASTTMLVHPSALYVGLRAQKPYVVAGTPYDVDVIGVDLDGKAAPGAAIDVASVRLVPERKHGVYTETEVDPQHCAVVAAADPVPCHFTTAKGGRYKVTATIVDRDHHPNVTELTYWVAGGDPIALAADSVARESVEIIPDKKTYVPGNTAELLVRSPIVPAEAIVTWQRSGIVKLEHVTLDAATKVITIPLTDAMVPNVSVSVEVVGQGVRADANGDPDPSLPKRPAYASGQIDLPISTRERALTVAVTPSAQKLAPGDSATLAVAVTDVAGKPVADAGVAIFVVDEAILALTAAQFADPLGAFYPARDAGVERETPREYVRLPRPPNKPQTSAASTPGKLTVIDSVEPADFNGIEDMDGSFGFGRAGFGPGGGGTGWGTIGTGRYGTIGHGSGTGSGYGVGGGRLRRTEEEYEFKANDRKAKPRDATAAIAVRTNFDPLAAFVPVATTDAAGHATVPIKVPDNLTRYRIVAIAVAGERQFGKGESGLTARLPMMVRPSAPRFLNFGDTFELPVVIQNQTDAAMTVRVALATQNLKLTAGAGREVSVPANERVEVRFPAAAMSPGTARFEVVSQVVGGSDSADAAEIALPVWTPATTEAFATYGVVDGDRAAIAQPVAMPGAIVPDFGGLEVSTASTNLQALTDAFLYIVHYPFDCAEQRASRMMAIAGLRDVLASFAVPKLPSSAALATSMAGDLEKLAPMQDGDGGFGFWDARDTWPYLTAYVAHALVVTQKKGYAVPGGMIERAHAYLRRIETQYDTLYTPDVRHAISAYALYVRRLMGDVDLGKARDLIAESGGAEQLPIETAGWLLAALAQQPGAVKERADLVRHLTNKVTETAGAAHFVVDYHDGGHLLLASSERADAIVLDALIAEQPRSDLIPKIVTGLLGKQKRGRWESTQENAFVLLALDRYFQTYEKTTPNFVASLWLGDDFAGKHAFAGHTTETSLISVPMAQVAAHDKRDLVIGKAGPGRLYYRIGMSYAPASLALAAADRGFVVTRAYEAVDDPKDVTRDGTGIWHVKAGARVRVKLNMINEARRFHVALVDPMPAGFEAMNSALAITGDVPRAVPPERHRRWRSWRAEWYEHENLRDERVEAFATELDDGVHPYVYVARATTPGTYVVPPPKAEEMYAPETFGRGATDRVVVE